MIDDSLIYSGTIPDERLHDMRRDLRSPMGGGRGGSSGSGPRGAGVFLVDSVFTRSQDDIYHADKSLFLNPLDKASYGVRIGDIVLFYLNNEGILCTGVVMAISNDDVTFKKHDEISTVGFSPSIATTDIPGGHRVTVTNEGSSDSFDVMDGVQGPQGEPFEFDDFTQEQLDELRSGVASVYYRKQEASVINFSDMDTIEIPFDNFTFADMLFVDIEGLMLTENQDYVINGSTIELTTPITHQGTRINFKLLTIMAITSEDLDTLLEGLSDFNGATDSAAGTHGLVPAPAAGSNLDVLFGNGEWGSLGLTTFSWGNDQSISIQANFDNEYAPSALFGSTSLPLASAIRAGLMKLEDYSKLQGIQAGAQANVIESISVNGTAVDVNNKNAAISIPQASSDSAGLMAASDKTKLDTISAFSSDNKTILFADGIWWRLFNEMTSNGHLLLKRIRSTGGATPRPIIETIDDMPMQAASEYIPGLMTSSDKAKLNGIEAGANAYALPAATTATLGGVKPDGTTVTVDGDGTIHAVESGTIPDGSVTFPKLSQDVVDLLDNKADIDGYYSQLTAGLAENLIGRGNAVSAEYLYRTAGGTADIEDGIATIDCIKGNTLVWNQLVVPWNGIGVGLTFAADGSKQTVSGTATSTSSTRTSSAEVVVGHKYFVIAAATDITNALIQYYHNHSHINGGIVDTSSWASGDCIGVGVSYTNGDAVSASYYPQLFDLTLMFGAGNEPATVEEFEAMFPLAYYPYSAPKMLPVDIRGIETVGFNLWDEELEIGVYNSSNGNKSTSTDYVRSANKIHVFPNTTYCFNVVDKSVTIYFYTYDESGAYRQTSIGVSSGGTFVVPNGIHYFAFALKVSQYGSTTYQNDICLHLVWSGYRNGEYEEHWSAERLIDTSRFFPTGMKKAGDKADALYADHYDTVIGAVDLGTLTWTYSDTYTIFMSSAIDNIASNGVNNLKCTKYEPSPIQTSLSPDKTIYTRNIGTVGVGVGVKDSAYTDAESFTAAMSGVILYYELATPTTTEIDPPLNLSYKVSDFGTERIMVDETADAPQTAPVPMEVEYGINAIDTIRRLPKEYQSHKSMGQLTAALESSLGVDITETWDETNGRYEYEVSDFELADDTFACIAAPDGPTATANHAVGTYLIMGGKLYKVITAIAAGDTIAAGTNVTQTTVMDELITLTA